MNTCVHCGIGFNVFVDYQEHLMTHRRIKTVESHPRAIERHPANTSGRSKQQIVAEAEASWLAPLLITSSNETEHLTSCRCNSCFQKELDKLILKQEKELGL